MSAKIWKRPLLVILLIFWGAWSLFAQDQTSSLVETFDLYSPLGFRTQLQWDSIRGQSRDLTDEAGHYHDQLEQGSHKYMVYPFWLGYEYKEIAGWTNLSGIERMGYLGYIIDPTTGYAKTTYSWLAENVLDDPDFKDIPADLILFCRGREETESFLQSDSAQLRCIQFAFDKLDRKKDNLRNPEGLNIYFPDFSFQQIEQFKLFVDKVSRYSGIFDEMEAKKYKLFVTLPKSCSRISDQLSDLLSDVDGVYYADFNRFGLDAQKIEIRSDSLVESLSFEKAYDRYRPFHYRSPLMWSMIRGQFCGKENEMANYRFRVSEGEHKYMIYPYWMGLAYADFSAQTVENIERMGYMGYVLNPLTGYPDLTNSWENYNVLDDSKFRNIPADLLLFCRGSAATDIFLESDSSRLHCIQTLFESLNRNRNEKYLNRNVKLRNPEGINIYFPDYSFQKKRELVQFVKSIALVNDSLPVREESTVEKAHLYLTFPAKAKKETPFLSCLLQYADSIYFSDYDQFGIDTAGVNVFSSATDTTAILQRIYNQFLMYRFSLNKYNQEKAGNSIASIIERGDPENIWEYYFLLILLLILVLLLTPLAYFLMCRFQAVVRKYTVGAIVVVLMILFEIFILMLFMIEEMSKEPIFFNPDVHANFYLLLLPIVLAGIYPALQLFQKQSVLP
ncbi:MAG: hypothetical protein ACEPOZ_09275 [Marinifilaceae bacterium]